MTAYANYRGVDPAAFVAREDLCIPGSLRPVRYAIELDGVDDYLLVPDSPSLKLEAPFTVEMWIKTKVAR